MCLCVCIFLYIFVHVCTRECSACIFARMCVCFFLCMFVGHSEIICTLIFNIVTTAHSMSLKQACNRVHPSIFSLFPSLSHSLSHAVTHSPAHTHTQSVTYSLTSHSLTHSRTRSLTHSFFAHSLLSISPSGIRWHLYPPREHLATVARCRLLSQMLYLEYLNSFNNPWIAY
jgi:hypothetical protein